MSTFRISLPAGVEVSSPRSAATSAPPGGFYPLKRAAGTGHTPREPVELRDDDPVALPRFYSR
jgi:hypothetical protein